MDNSHRQREILFLPLSFALAAMFPRQSGFRGRTPLLSVLIHSGLETWTQTQHIVSIVSDEFPELSDTNWLCDFAFAVDIFSHMNELNVKLQGKDQFVHDMYTNVRAFKSKLILFSRQMSNKSFAHFPTLAVQKEAARNAKKYSKSLDDLHREFCRRFSDFPKIDKSLQLVSCPVTRPRNSTAGAAIGTDRSSV